MLITVTFKTQKHRIHHKFEIIMFKMVTKKEQHVHQKLNYNQRQKPFNKINVTVVVREMRNRRQYTKQRKTIKILNSISAKCFHSEPVLSNTIPTKVTSELYV